MGLAIHYHLKSDANSPEQARQLVEQLHQTALDVPMSEVGDIVELAGAACDVQTAENDSLRWLLTQARRITAVGKGYRFIVPLHIFAFSAWPGEGCEVANFGLATYPDVVEGEEGILSTGLSGWSWESFCKTQYASNPDDGGIANFIRCHLAMIRLLDRANALGMLESVVDDSHFWENRDVKALAETIGNWNSQIAAIVGQYKDRVGAVLSAPITEFPNFEHLEADGRKVERRDPRP